MSRRCAAALALVLVALVMATQPHAAPQDPQAPPLPTFRNTLNFVRVDVVVTDADHRPVTDLTEADFEVLEDGRRQTIQDFKAVRIDAPRPGEPEAPPIRTLGDQEIEAARDDVRLFAVFLEPSIRCPDALRVREALIRFVRTLEPTDMVAVTDAVSIVNGLDFTRDHPTLVGAIRRLGLSPDMNEAGARPRAGAGRYPRVGPRCLTSTGPGTIARMEELSARLAALREGRKSIIYVGSTIGGLGSQLTLPFHELLTTLNRNNTTVYVLDPTGLTVESNFHRSINLRALAEGTGGLAIVNTNRMEEGLRTVAQDATFYYLLGYASPALADGKFHGIDVKVRRRDVHVRSRSGFWSFAPSPARKPATVRVEAVVPATEAGDPVSSRGPVGRPRVFRASNARELRAIAADATASPVAGREFSRTDRLLIRFDSAEEGMLLHAALLNRSGQFMLALQVSPAQAGGTHQIDLPLSNLAPGAYAVEISSPSDDSQARTRVAFRVGS